MDKKSIIGLVLIFGIFVGYMWWVSPSAEERAAMEAERARVMDSIVNAQRAADSAAAVQAQLDSLAAAGDSSALAATTPKIQDMGVFNAATTGEARQITINNGKMSLTLNTQGGRVDRVVLADYKTFDQKELELITPSDDNLDLAFYTIDNRNVNTRLLNFQPFVDNQPWTSNDTLTLAEGDSVTIALRAMLDSSESYLEYAYTVHGDSYEVDFDINFVGLSNVIRNTNYLDLNWHNRMNRQEMVSDGSRGKGSRNSDRERYYSSVYYKPPKDNVESLKMGSDDKEQVKTNLDWIAFKQQYFCAIITVEGEQAFENADVSVSTDLNDTNRNYLTDMRATIGIPYSPETQQMKMGFYFGPTKFRDLKAMDRGFEKMLPLGWTVISKSISRWLIIPAFNFLENFIKNYGLIILVFTLLIRLVLLPLVYKSYKGGAIMRILKPEMDALNAKYPKPEQAMQKQQASMALQKRAGYNPMAGCLPVLIQMPFLTAMFMFFPIAIELRQKGFLWCDDLSTYDSVLDFGFNIPLYGDHVSLFCLMMFGMQFFYTWYTMRNQNFGGQMKGMKFVMYFMPFMMLFIFNSQSAGLNLYYLASLTFTMATMMLIRRFTSEKKVRAHMAAYDQKHANGTGKSKRKSNFAKRLEELQKQAEQMQKQKEQMKKR
ncbi:MAG: membrane protein insertase YidC [Bacteroidales bacterium]|nr:membrane protein insertase YidC [Bacteroidales bacterium]